MNFGEFKKIIWDYYKENKRDFPWRETSDPYKILVSEVMLQQTQTYRVLPKYQQFLSQFPNFEALAHSSLAEVLTIWSGLGYNRRGKYLKEAAEHIVNQYQGNVPKDPKELEKLPGLGKYSSAAIVVFSYNLPLPFIETNIRRVFIHCFFADKDAVSDKEIMPLIEQTIDQKSPREWYYALMDYGAYLALTIKNPNHKSKHYTKQSKFEGSIRKIRGEILRQLLSHITMTKDQLLEIIIETPDRVDQALLSLEKDHMIIKEKDIYSLYKEC